MSFQIISVWFMTCLPAINTRAMSNEDGASIGYRPIGCDIAHVLGMRRGESNYGTISFAAHDARPLRTNSSMTKIGWIRQSTHCVVVLLFARH